MKHFDVEAYAKTMLNSMAIVPEEDGWQEISEKIDKEWYSKQKKTRYIKIALVMLFLFVIPVPIEKSYENLISADDESTGIVAENLSNHYQIHNDVVIDPEPSSFIVGNGKKSDEVTSGGEAEKRKYQLASAKKLKKNIVQNEDIQEKEENSKAVEKLSYAVVTDAEIDSLIEKARQNLEMERALQREREAFAHEMLAEIKKETETKNQGLYHDLKRGYAKLKTVISN